MRFQFASFFVAFLSATAVAARKCGQEEPSEELRSQGRVFAAEARANPDEALKLAAEPISVDTWFHVITSKNGGGNIPDSQLKKQFEVMNTDYAGIGVKFVLQGITKTVNDDWANDQDELKMKKKLRKGDYKTLNIYFHKLSNDLLGLCYFPTTVKPGSDDFYLDGCSVLFSSVPGGNTTHYNLGKTVVHEVGHWFGLFHTFQGGCTGGDQVSDTPAEKVPASGCPVGLDTCTGPNYPGVDPIHNFMDYSYDTCMTEFTAGQATRITQMWKKYRDL